MFLHLSASSFIIWNTSELILHRQTNRQRTNISAGRQIMLKHTAVGDRVCHIYCTVGTCLVEQIHDVERTKQMSRRLPADTGKRLPMTVEIGIVDAVRILLAEISHVEPATPSVIKLVRRIDLEQYP